MLLVVAVFVAVELFGQHSLEIGRSRGGSQGVTSRTKATVGSTVGRLVPKPIP